MGKGDQTRQRIIEQAAPLFNQRGYEGTSLQELMKATGLEKGGIYRHFESKEALAVETMRQALTSTVDLHMDHLAQVDGALDKLRDAVTFFIEKPSKLQGGCPLMNTAIDSDDGNPALRQLALTSLQDWRMRLAKIVSDGKRRREILGSADPQAIANTIVASLEGALMISRLEGTDAALHNIRSSLFTLFATIENKPASANL